MCRLLLFICSFCLLQLCHANQFVHDIPKVKFVHQVHLRSGIIDVHDAISKAAQSTPVTFLSTEHTEASDINQQWLLHVKMPITEFSRKAVAEAIYPYRLLQYIPHGTFVVMAPAHALNKLRQAPSVLHVSEYLPSHKIAPEVAQHVLKASRQLQSIDGVMTVSSLSVQLSLPEKSVDACQHVAFQVQKSLHTQFQAHGDVIQVKAVNEHLMSVKAPTHLLNEVATTVASHHEVHYLHPQERFEVFNKFAKLVTQSGSRNSTPVWDQGLLGHNQIVGVGDTGIDHDSCFFADPNVPTPIDRVDFRHRKIVMYKAIADSSDASGGHGTHVCGSIAGEVLTTDAVAAAVNSPYNGMAPKAKLAFLDVMRTTGGDLMIPDNLYGDYFMPAYRDANARLFSSSWGAEERAYTTTSLETDRFAYDHQDFLPLFAAGNYGEKGFWTIATPGNAKNTLAVGSSKNSWLSFVSQGSAIGFEVLSPPELTQVVSVVPADPTFSVAFSSANIKSSSVVLANPQDACSPLTNADQAKDKVVFVYRGTCTFHAKATQVSSTGAAMMIVISASGPAAAMGKQNSEPYINIPTAMITEVQALPLLRRVSDLMVKAPVQARPVGLDIDFLSSFSSRGPTVDGRFKPDVLSVGENVVSARSDGSTSTNNCPVDGSGLLQMRGTSMATPVTAGTAALVRQYFAEGFHRRGLREPEYGFNATASLVKAILINSASTVGGWVFKNSDSDPGTLVEVTTRSPSVFQGYGRIELDRALRFLSNTDSAIPRFELVVKDSQPLKSTESMAYCVRVNSFSVPFKSTIVWTDPPASPAVMLALINNLDLLVTHVESSQAYLGNDLSYNDTQGITRTKWDELNNVEQVSIGSGRSGVYAIKVIGTHIPVAPQNFSLVVTGDVVEVDLAQCTGAAVCPNSCSSRGTCQPNGLCKCNLGFFGPDCSTTSEPFSSPIASRVSLEVGAWGYFHFDVTAAMIQNRTEDLRFTMLRTSTVGDPDMYVQFNDFPTLNSALYANTDCDSCNGASSSPRTIDISSTTLREGRYVVGVYGYCCDATTVSLSVSVGSYIKPANDASNPSTSLSTTTVAIIVVASLWGVGALVAGIFFYVRRQRHSAEMGANAVPFGRLSENGPGTVTIVDGEIQMRPTSRT